jgi:hypothetical protein
MGHNLAIIVMQTLLFIGLYGINTNFIHLFVLLEHQCCAHCLDMNVDVYLCCLHTKVMHMTFVFKQYEPMK